MPKVLILTNATDSHADAVSKCLSKKGASWINWFTDEFLTNQKVLHKLSSEGEQILIRDHEKEIDIKDVDVVWFRRPELPKLPSNVHSSDIKFIEAENRKYIKSLWMTIGGKAKWVNPYSSFEKSNSKVIQLQEAAKLGLTIPNSIITNDKNAIVDFIAQNHPDGTLYKTFSPGVWNENESIYSCYSVAITPDMILDEYNMSLTPGIYQKIIKKKFELRITFFGEDSIAVKIHNSNELDWRVLTSISKIKLSPFTVPLEIERKCIALMKKLDIVFGCFDFIVTPEGEYIFLEVNEMGQFLWIEENLPELHLLDKFCEFLLSNNGSTKERYSQVKPVLLKEVSS